MESLIVKSFVKLSVEDRAGPRVKISAAHYLLKHV